MTTTQGVTQQVAHSMTTQGTIPGFLRGFSPPGGPFRGGAPSHGKVNVMIRVSNSNSIGETGTCYVIPWPDQHGVSRSIDQSHRYGRHQAALREPAGSYDKTTRIAICFEHKTQYLLIRAPYTRIVVFWHISNIPPMISQSQISCNTPTFYVAAIFMKYCYTTGSWLL